MNATQKSKAVSILRGYGIDRFSMNNTGESYLLNGDSIEVRKTLKHTYDAFRSDIERIGLKCSINGQDGYGRLMIVIK